MSDPTPPDRPPFDVLRELAARIGPRTEGLVVGDVYEYPAHFSPRPRADLFFVVPNLGHYRLRVVGVLALGTAPYPMRVFDHLRPNEPGGVDCPDAASFRDAVQQVLDRPETTTVLRNLVLSARESGGGG